MSEDRPDPRQVERALEEHPNDTLAREVHALRLELERERMRLAACGVAAHGGRVADILPEYRSDALEATVRQVATLARVATLCDRWLGEEYLGEDDDAYSARIDYAKELRRTLRADDEP